MGDLGLRVVSAIVMVGLALSALWAGGKIFAVFWLVASAAILWEWLGLSCSPHRLPSTIAGAIVLAVAAALVGAGATDFALILCIAGAGLIAFIERGARPAWGAAGLAYASALLVAIVSLRGSLLYGFEAVLWLFAVVWGTDILAYFGGRLIGGPKLWPQVSPSKTWSGFLTGVVGGAICGVVTLMIVLPSGRQSLIAFALLGLLTGAVSQAGDFLESGIKRHFGVKDSSQLIPGHGGVMDRLDGFTAAAVLAAAIGLSRGGLVNPATGLLVW